MIIKKVKNPIFQGDVIVGYKEVELLFATKNLYACYDDKVTASWPHEYDGIDTTTIVLRVKKSKHIHQSVVLKIKATLLKRKEVQQIIQNFDLLVGRLSFKRIDKMTTNKRFDVMMKFKEATYNALLVEGRYCTKQELSEIIRGYLPHVNTIPRVRK